MLRLTDFCSKSYRYVNLFQRSSISQKFVKSYSNYQKLTPRGSVQDALSVSLSVLKSTSKSGKVQLIFGSAVLGSAAYSIWPTTAQCATPILVEETASRLLPRDVLLSSPETKFDWRKLWELLKPDKYYLLAAVAAAMFVAGLNTYIPRVLGELVNVLAKLAEGACATGYDFNAVKLPGAKLLGLYSAQALFTFVYIWLLSGIGERLALNIRQKLFHSIIQQDMAFFDRERTGELSNRLMSDVQEFKSAFKQVVSQGLRSSTQVIGCTVSLMSVSPQMTLLMSTVVPTVIGIGAYLGTWLRVMSKEAQAQNLRVAMLVEEAFSNIRTVRAFAMEEPESQMLNKEVDVMREKNEKLGFNIALFQAGTNLFLNGMVLGTLWYGGYLLSVGNLSPGDLMSFLVASQTIQRSLSQLSLLYGQALRGMTAGNAIFDYMNLEPTVCLRGGKIIPYHSLVPNIIFNDVTFAYPTRSNQDVLKHFNLTIPAGKTVAIVGSSGNGKSTVASLLARIYDVSEGSITLSGTDLRYLDPSWLRGNVIGIINQEPVLFATTVIENIRYSKPGATDEEVWNAAKLAGADEFIRGFPAGYDTLVGEKGVAVSGGQKQRIAIARALLKKPTILIMDEATSALDAESEKEVLKTLDEAAKGRTVLVIAHRLSTVRNADLIVVLQQGTIVESGTHDELWNKKGYYWTLIQHQETHEKPK